MCPCRPESATGRSDGYLLATDWLTAPQPPPGRLSQMRRGSGFLNPRQRRLAWFGFIAAALQVPVSAHLLSDASWLFSLCVSLLVATVIVADDADRRRPARSHERSE